MRFKNEILILFFIIFAGFIYRVYLFQFYPYVSFDSAEYARLGKNLIEYGTYSFSKDGSDSIGVIFPPGYPIFIGLFNLFIKDLYFASITVSFLAGLLSIYLIYKVAKKLFNGEAGLFAAFLLAFSLPIADFSVKAMAESLLMLSILGIFYLHILNVRHRSCLNSAFLGLLVGFSFLIKPESLPFITLPLIYIYIFRKEGKDARKKVIAGSFLAVMAFTVIVLPYLFFIKNKTGSFSFSGKSGVNVATGEFLKARKYSDVSQLEYMENFHSLNENDEVGISKELSQSLFQSVRKDPVGFFYRYVVNFLAEFYYIGLYFFSSLTIFLLIFSFVNKKIYKNPEIYALFFPVVLIFLSLPAYQVRQRYLFPAIVFLIIISSFSYGSLDKILENFHKNSKRFKKIVSKENLPKVNRMMKILIIISVLYGVFFPLVKYLHPSFVEHKKAGDFIRNNISSEYERINVMASKNTVCFYANSKCTIAPFAKLDELLAYSERKGVDYIVVDQRYMSSYPDYQDLMNLDKKRERYRLVYEDKNLTLIKVFEVIK